MHKSAREQNFLLVATTKAADRGFSRIARSHAEKSDNFSGTLALLVDAGPAKPIAVHRIGKEVFAYRGLAN